MTIKMPRGVIPTPRSEFAASEPYRPEGGAEIFVPTGEFPTPNYELASAEPYREGGRVPESFIAWPTAVASWGDAESGNASWAEEAFAKACAEPKIFIPPDVVRLTSRECGSSNFAAFMQTRGFQMDGKAYLDGSFNSVNWTNPTALNGAIANVGPVKIGVASTSLAPGERRQATFGTNVWAVCGLPAGQSENHYATLFGFGPLATLVDLFERHGVNVDLPPCMPAGLCYAMYILGSIGIIDRKSLINITGEAWVRNPTTVVKTLNVRL